jgi:hypothetical protein
MKKMEFMKAIDKLTDKGYDYSFRELKDMFGWVHKVSAGKWLETCISMGLMSGKPTPEFIISQARR